MIAVKIIISWMDVCAFSFTPLLQKEMGRVDVGQPDPQEFH